MSEVPVPGRGEWRKSYIEASPDSHRAMSEEADHVQTSINQIGWDATREQVVEDLKREPDNVEYRRRATLFSKLEKERSKELDDMLHH